MIWRAVVEMEASILVSTVAQGGKDLDPWR